MRLQDGIGKQSVNNMETVGFLFCSFFRFAIYLFSVLRQEYSTFSRFADTNLFIY